MKRISAQRLGYLFEWLIDTSRDASIIWCPVSCFIKFELRTKVIKKASIQWCHLSQDNIFFSILASPNGCFIKNQPGSLN